VPATDPLLLALFLAARQAGHPLSTDTNGCEPEGFGTWERIISRGGGCRRRAPFCIPRCGGRT
jgi:hypothetical protein